ncbi:hypothetical protein ETD83_31430 [Actinomadura soli]|uniref:Uncharacterized protein n=1 Tax=Actinomadura soli TaxID=2508997 RepID=A0A5C4J575_9ACTN|nr:hypothetical protein [Actinomadura soli]TMQ91331.1 hypothetical protein ETD83_31430 [Actinomadura soli]
MAAPTRTATPVGGTIALVLLGGAVATVIGTIMTFAAVYETDVLAHIRHSTAFYALQCVIVGLFTAAGLMLTRPRGPIAPIVAALAALVALFVGISAGLLLYMVTHGGVSGDTVIDVLKPRFDAWDLLAPLAAGAVGGLRVLMVASSLAPRRPPGHPFGQPPGHPFGQAPGQHFGQAPGQPGGPHFGRAPGQPFGQATGQPFGQPGGHGPGQAMPGQAAQAPYQGAPYQAPPVPGPGQGPAPGGPQGGAPPFGGG